MRRLLIVYNPRSSRAAAVREEVLAPARKLKGCMVGKYEVAQVGVEENVARLAKILKDEDLVVAAGGDATGVIAANAILQSSRDVELAVLPYGNFNDFANTLKTKKFNGGNQNACFRTHSRPFGRAYSPETSIFDCQSKKYYVLEVLVDGKHWRYATCYVTIGMMAEAVKLYDTPKVRKKLKSRFGRAISSYTELAKWYFRHRRKEFLPEFKLNGELQPRRTSDYAAVNGRRMARVMRGGEDFLKPRTFRSETDRLTNFWRLCKLMVRSMLARVPGSETKGDVLEFSEPASVEIQAEGEYQRFEGVRKIEIRKAEKWLKVVTRD